MRRLKEAAEKAKEVASTLDERITDALELETPSPREENEDAPRDEDSEREAWQREREQRLSLLTSGQQAESELAVSARKGKEALNFSFGAVKTGLGKLGDFLEEVVESDMGLGM